MTTMPIDNHPLTPRRLQFIGIGVNKLTFKSINIIRAYFESNLSSYYSSYVIDAHARLHPELLVGWQVNKNNSPVGSTSILRRRQKGCYKLHIAV